MLSRTAATTAFLLSCLMPGGVAEVCASDARFPITADNVATAMQSRGLPVETPQVSLLAPVTASQIAPELRIVSARKLNQSDMAIRVGCTASTVCLPFYVVLHGGEQDRILALLSKERPDGRKGKQPATKPCIRSGDRASLVMEKQDMRITVPVIALQNGRLGETIRVRDTDRKKLYRAEVVGPTLLKGAL